MAAEGLYIGLMSGTSMDGIDAVLLELRSGECHLRATGTRPYSEALQASLRSIARGEHDDVHALATADRRVGEAFAHAVEALLASASIETKDVVAIGSHGQTVRHHPGSPGNAAYTVQIGDPSTIAEITGITTIADFRRADIAAGGEGAPLAPVFHAIRFGAVGVTRAIVNIGGISNATLLHGDAVTAGFDCGPGNTLLDAWIQRERGDAYDAHGAWSAEHTILDPLLDSLSADAFFHRSGPKSTGVEYFNLKWLDAHLHGDEDAGQVQATLAELSARAIEDSLLKQDERPESVYACGGGARNIDLMRRLGHRLNGHGMDLRTTDELGLDSEWVEAAAWAWLAHARLNGIPGNAPVVTGASGPRVLGAVYKAPQR